METGDSNPALQDNFTNLIDDNQLIINLRYDGLTMVVCSRENRKVLDVQETTWLAAKDSGYLIEEASKFFDERGISLRSAGAVHWVLSLSKFTLIPDIFFQQGEGHTLLKNSTRLEEDDLIHSDFWTQLDIVCVYAIPQAIKNYIHSVFERSTIAHCGHSFNALRELQSHKSGFCLLQVSAAFAELYIVQNNQLVFFNQFPYDVKEDLLYYVLFALEQNRILAPELELKFAGKIQRGDGMYKMLNTYIGKVEELGIPAGLTSARQITPHQLRCTAHLIASI